MKTLSILSLAIMIFIAVAGCTEKPRQTSAIQVQSPSDKPALPSRINPQPVPPQPAPKQSLQKGKFVTTKTGLKYRDLKIGRGPKATPGKVVTVHYRGWLDNGVEFDSSRSRNEPFSFTLGQGEVIRGWEEGVAGMRVGGVRELIVPPELGYGERGMGKIPPNSTLNFEVELLKVGR